uniref:Glomulin-like n=1 Tax=Hirondellea gigas TaxID=1518452 RepID=A0A6A7G036_9CRUS
MEISVEEGLTDVKLSHVMDTDKAKVDLGSILWDLVDAAKYEEAMVEIQNSKNKERVTNDCMDIIPVLTLKLQESEDILAIECLEGLLVHVSNVAKVKEVMIVFLEELQAFKGKENYRALLRPMQVALKRQVSRNCSPTLHCWAFRSVLDHMARMELPSDYNLEGRERKLLDAAPAVMALSDHLQCVVDFFKVFYEDIILAKLIFSNKIPNTNFFMAKTLLKLFDKPLTFLDVYSNKKGDENTVYRTSSKLIIMIIRLIKNPIKLFSEISYKTSDPKKKNINKKENETIDKEGEFESEDDEDDDVAELLNASQTSLATMYYCMFSQNMSIESVPCVYSSQHKFLSCLPLVCTLLSKVEHLAMHKGVLLARSLITHIDNRSMPAACLDSPSHYQLSKLLVNIMTYTENKEIRLCALSFYRTYITKLDYDAVYRLFEYLLQSQTHAGFLGFIITEIKQNSLLSLKEKRIASEFSDGFTKGEDLSRTVPSYSKFTGQSLWKLVYLACHLPDGERTDFLECGDKVLSALNLVLFLLIRATNHLQKQQQQTSTQQTEQPVTSLENDEATYSQALHQSPSNFSIHQSAQSITFNPPQMLQHVAHLRKELLTPMQRGLQISREHYELKLKDLSESSPPADGNKFDFQVNVSDSILPGLDPGQEKKVVASALCRFDLINCVLARVETAATELMATFTIMAK